MKGKNGEWIKSPPEIREAFKDHFEKILKGRISYLPIDPRWMHGLAQVTEEQSVFLLTPFSDAEIKKATFSSKPLKSPRPDGVPPAFLQKYWHLVGPNICEVIHSFFATRYLLK